MINTPEIEASAAALLPERLDQLGPATLNAWRTEITDPDLRKAILANPSLHDQILNEILGDLKDKCVEVSVNAETLARVQLLINGDLDALMGLIGCAWHSNSLAAQVVIGSIDQSEDSIPMELLREALVFRAYAAAAATPPAKGLKLSEAMVDGHLALTCWLDTLGAQLAALFALRRDVAPMENRPTDAAKRAALCAEVLSSTRDPEAR